MHRGSSAREGGVEDEDVADDVEEVKAEDVEGKVDEDVAGGDRGSVACLRHEGPDGVRALRLDRVLLLLTVLVVVLLDGIEDVALGIGSVVRLLGVELLADARGCVHYDNKL